MHFSQAQAGLFIPDSQSAAEALQRTTHLGIGAHQDDLEFMALHGILECFQRTNLWFGGVTCTDGGGSARTGPYAEFSDAEMKQVRAQEQRTAANIGQYSFMAQLAHPSISLKQADKRNDVVAELTQLLMDAKPEVVYTHNPADKHATHIGVYFATVEAIRTMPKDARPKRLLGCEMWRGLDWLNDDEKVLLSVSAHPNLAAALTGVFDSQISGGKRYDMAIEGRRVANATFYDSHSVDAVDRVAYAMDLTPLITDDALDPVTFAEGFMQRFQKQARAALDAVRG